MSCCRDAYSGAAPRGKDYGTNNPAASEDGECALFGRHVWVIAGFWNERGRNTFRCRCGARHVIDSSD